ncbi:MAG: DNA topoisomerase IV subunit A [Myxococcota bacterium]
MSATASSAVPLHEATRQRYLNYALSVITSRALPDVRDGLKPVQRRILYGMYHNLKLYPDSRFRKSATVVGEVMGKYHPHGDSAIYDALVRMAQPFSLRHPLILGQGNFGSLDGDPAAAMRYSECKLSPISIELLSELKQKTVDYRPNYDGQQFEPIVLPAQFPQLLVNGAEGIAVGMATRIPPHNLREVIDAAVMLIETPDASIGDLMRKFRGPDFPTGGELLSNRAELQEIYESGSGSVRYQGQWTLEADGRTRYAIITSIPYGVNKSVLIEKIGGLIVNRSVPQLIDIRDESTDDVRIVMTLRKGRRSPDVDAAAAMAYLYKHTNLQTTFPVNLTCLVPSDNPEVSTPIRADLKQILRYWLDFRQVTVRRRFEYELQRLNERIHILEALKRVFEVLDEVIAMIRSSEGKRDARSKLITRFQFSEAQAEAILELKLYRLARLEIFAIEEELEEKRSDAQRISAILASNESLWEVVRGELLEIRRLYGEKRRTSLGGEEIRYEESAYIVAEDTYLIVTQDGWIKRQGSFTDPDKIRIRDGDQLMAIALADTRKTVTFFTDRGGAYVMRLDGVPATTGYGDPIQKHFTFADGETVIGVAVHDPRALPDVDIPEDTDSDTDEPQPPYGVALTQQGKSLRFSLSMHAEPSNRTGRRYAKLEKSNDGVVAVYVSNGTETVSLASARGRGLCFPVADISTNKGPAKGVIAIKLDKGDWVHSFELTTESMAGLTVTTPQGRQEIIRPNKYASSRATRGRHIIKRGTFKAWPRPLIRYDLMHQDGEE